MSVAVSRVCVIEPVRVNWDVVIDISALTLVAESWICYPISTLPEFSVTLFDFSNMNK